MALTPLLSVGETLFYEGLVILLALLLLPLTRRLAASGRTCVPLSPRDRRQ